MFINKEDIDKWIKKGKSEYIEHFFIDPDCISLKNSTEYQYADGHAIKAIRKKYGNINFEEKLNDLIAFIEKNHNYMGEDSIPFGFYTIMPNMRNDPILVPKKFSIMKEGLKRGINYIIHFDYQGECSFLELNLCSIYKYRPSACKRFPYMEDGHLRNDEYFLSICKGIK